MEIVSLKLNMTGTLYDVSEENATINENNRFTKRLNFEWLLL